MKPLFMTLLLVTLTGCSTTGGRCVGEFDYQKAVSLPTASSTGDIRITPSGSALVIPPASSEGKPYAEFYPDPEDPDDQLVRCLDTPPRMQQAATD